MHFGQNKFFNRQLFIRSKYIPVNCVNCKIYLDSCVFVYELKILHKFQKLPMTKYLTCKVIFLN